MKQTAIFSLPAPVGWRPGRVTSAVAIVIASPLSRRRYVLNAAHCFDSFCSKAGECALSDAVDFAASLVRFLRPELLAVNAPLTA